MANRTSLFLVVASVCTLTACNRAVTPQSGSDTTVDTQSGVTTYVFDSSSSVSAASQASSSSSAEEIVTIDQHMSRTELHPGDTFMLTITLKNPSQKPLGAIVVENAFPPNKVKVTEAGNGTVATDRVTWNFDNLFANQVTTLILRGKVNADLQPGENLLNIVTVRSPFLLTPKTSTREYVVAPRLPHTGATDYTAPITTNPYISPINL